MNRESFIIRKLGGAQAHQRPAHPAEYPSTTPLHNTPTYHGATQQIPANQIPSHPSAAPHHSTPAYHGGASHQMPAHPSVPHYGSNSTPTRSPIHCFFFLLSGTVLVEIGGKTYLIKEHELVVIPAGQVFSIKYFENATGYMGGFNTSFISGANASENAIAKYDFLRIWGSPKIELGEEAFSRQIPLFDRIYEEYTSPQPNAEIIKAYLTAILAEADVIYRSTITEVISHNNGICNRFLNELFKGDGNRNLPVAEYARKLGVTPNHLNKVVKGATGKSPSVWIEEAIIQDARLLLKGTDLPLGEIAARVGIMDQSYFARKFRQHEGMTPSEYRQK